MININPFGTFEQDAVNPNPNLILQNAEQSVLLTQGDLNNIGPNKMALLSISDAHHDSTFEQRVGDATFCGNDNHPGYKTEPALIKDKWVNPGEWFTNPLVHVHEPQIDIVSKIETTRDILENPLTEYEMIDDTQEHTIGVIRLLDTLDALKERETPEYNNFKAWLRAVSYTHLTLPTKD